VPAIAVNWKFNNEINQSSRCGASNDDAKLAESALPLVLISPLLEQAKLQAEQEVVNNKQKMAWSV
jgi:hypothetical protein